MQEEDQLSLNAQAQAEFLVRTAKLGELSVNGEVLTLIDKFIACFDHLPPQAGYKYIPDTARQVCIHIQERIGAQAIPNFLYACILKALLNSMASELFARLPSRVKRQQLKHYGRIAAGSDAIAKVCGLENDLFHKDLGLGLMRLYAAAAQLVDFRAGVGRSMLLKNGIDDLPKRIAIFAKIGGFKPFFEIHTHLSYLEEFNEEGWNECYRCCAELYSLHPEVLGMYGGSWFYDEALAEISPRLGYLRDVPRNGGAYLLFDSISEQSTENATSTSPTRKKLYAEGKYQPKSFALIWPRDAQIDWAKRNTNP